MLEQINRIFALLTICSIAFAQEGDRCILKSTGEEGVCRISPSCPVIEQQAKNGVSATLCGFSRLVPIICCPPHNFEPNRNPSTSTDSNRNLRKSEQKCEEYSKAVTETVMIISLDTNSKPISFNEAKCDYNSVPLIVGGEPALVKEFPFMAAIGYNSDEDKWRCGGTLISDRYVLTAAHCNYTSDAGPPKTIRLGALDLSNENEVSKHKDYDVARVIVHPDYSPRVKYNDIALIQTKERIIFTEFIRPACLYTKEDISPSSGVATGWGSEEFGGDNSDILRKVTLNIYDNSKCVKAYQGNKEVPRGILSSMLCAGELLGDKDTCQGDSGGPLLITKKKNQCIFYVIGVTSFGKLCGEKNIPAVYSRVSSYVDWIERTIW